MTDGHGHAPNHHAHHRGFAGPKGLGRRRTRYVAGTAGSGPGAWAIAVA